MIKLNPLHSGRFGQPRSVRRIIALVSAVVLAFETSAMSAVGASGGAKGEASTGTASVPEEAAAYFESARLAGLWYVTNQSTEKRPWAGMSNRSADEGRLVYEYYPAKKSFAGCGNWGQALGIMSLLALHRRTNDAQYLESAKLAGEYLKSLQLLDRRDQRTFGALRETTPQALWTYPRDAATGGMGFAALYRATGDKEYLERLRFLCDWFIDQCMGPAKWPAYRYEIGREKQDRSRKEYFMVGSGLMFYYAYRLTGERRYIAEGLVPICDPLAADYHFKPWGPSPPQLESQGIWSTQDDFASEALLAAYRATGNRKYFDAAKRHADWLVSVQRDNGAYTGFGSAVHVSGLHLLDLCRIIDEEKMGIDPAPYLRAVDKGARFGLSLQERSAEDSRSYGGLYGQNPLGISRERIHHRETGYSVIFHLRYEGKVTIPYYSIFGWD